MGPEQHTVAELVERYVARCHNRMALGRIKLRTIESYEIQFRNHILPALGDMAVADVTEDDLYQLILHLAEGRPATAERCLILLKSMFRQAERLGWRRFGSSPAADLPRVWVRKVPRAASLEEVARLGAALSEVEQFGAHWWRVAQLVRLLALTGRRLRELMHGRTAWVDLDRREYNIPDSKVGAAFYHIPGPAVPIFTALIADAADSPWLFRGMKPGTPMNNPYGAWNSICRRASLDGLTFRHLRHLHASAGRDLGYSLEVIGKLLGHRTRRATEIYAHWITDGYRLAAENTSALLAGWLAGSSENRSKLGVTARAVRRNRRRQARLLGPGSRVL